MISENAFTQSREAMPNTPPASSAEEDVSVDASTVISQRDLADQTVEEPETGEHSVSLRHLRHVHQSLLNAGYELREKLGGHSRCHVHSATSIATGKKVVVKVLVEPLPSSTSALARFHQEGKTLTSLAHPNLVQIIDCGRETNINFLVLELVPGENLATRVSRSGALEPALAISCVAQAAAGLGYLHENGIIHRDVKPANLVLSPSGHVKLIDLGLALSTDDEDRSITRLFDDRVLGTADYMSPEQALDCHRVDARSDIYSLGCTLYLLLAGRAPFFGDTLAARLMEHQYQSPPSLTESPVIPERLVALCLKMMAKQPADRFQSAGEVAEELAKCRA